jgi:hypothetical protein
MPNSAGLATMFFSACSLGTYCRVSAGMLMFEKSSGLPSRRFFSSARATAFSPQL